MGLLNFLFKRLVRANTRILIQSYLKVKEQNPDCSEKELYALVLDSRQSYVREGNDSLVFTYKTLTIDVSTFESITHLLATVIIAEERDLNMSASKLAELNSMLGEVIHEELQAAGTGLSGSESKA